MTERDTREKRLVGKKLRRKPVANMTSGVCVEPATPRKNAELRPKKMRHYRSRQRTIIGMVSLAIWSRPDRR